MTMIVIMRDYDNVLSQEDYHRTITNHTIITMIMIMMLFRRADPYPDLVSWGEGSGGVQQGQDDHEAGQEVHVPLLP